jgi:hypothetical protein
MLVSADPDGGGKARSDMTALLREVRRRTGVLPEIKHSHGDDCRGGSI